MILQQFDILLLLSIDYLSFQFADIESNKAVRAFKVGQFLKLIVDLFGSSSLFFRYS